MTCIVGLKLGGQIYIAGDSAGTRDHLSTLRKDPKVFAAHGILYGCTSSFRMAQLLRYKFVPPARPSGLDLHAYMATEFVDALRECFKSGGFNNRQNDVDQGGSFLVGIDRRLFEICSDYQVAEQLADFHAIGSGEELALGAMYCAFLESPNAHEMLLYALCAASAFNCTVRPPFQVISTKNHESEELTH